MEMKKVRKNMMTHIIIFVVEGGSYKADQKNGGTNFDEHWVNHSVYSEGNNS